MIEILFKIGIVFLVIGLPTLAWGMALHKLGTGKWTPWEKD